MTKIDEWGECPHGLKAGACVACRPAPKLGELLTVLEIASRFRVSTMTVYRLIHAGELASVRIGRSYRVPVSAIEGLTGLYADERR